MRLLPSRLSSIGFTKNELDAIKHRLGAWDAIADCFEDSDICSFAEAEMACDALKAKLDRSSILQIAELSKLEVEVLVDCVEGSTWAACASEESPQFYAARMRVLSNVAAKMSAAFAREVTWPTH